MGNTISSHRNLSTTVRWQGGTRGRKSFEQYPTYQRGHTFTQRLFSPHFITTQLSEGSRRNSPELVRRCT